MEFHHVSVLREETIHAVLGDPAGIYVDCTLGGGGHSRALADLLVKDGLIIGLDQDEDAIRAATERMQDAPCRFTAVQRNFRYLGEVLDNPERGFSYQHDGPLDMRMDRHGKKSAYDVINAYDEADLYRIIKDYGEERWAKRIASFIVKARREKPFERTEELVRVIKQAIPAGARKDGPHPAKRTFQAVRIEVNDELKILQDTFEIAANRLKPGGHIGIITFHSLEDRIAKQTLRKLATGCICPPHIPVCTCHHEAILKVKGKGIGPSKEELELNPRARSAKLRVGTRI